MECKYANTHWRNLGDMIKKDLLAVLGSRLWQALAGFVTAILLVIKASPEEQGWYYSFLSVTSLSTLFELGLSTTIIQITSHLFMHLSWIKDGGVIGKHKKNFISFFKQASKKYRDRVFLFAPAVLAIGAYIFLNKANSGYSIIGSSWILPWLFLVIITSANFYFLSFYSVVEGSGNIAEIYSLRLLQAVLGSVACWVAIYHHHILFSVVMIPFFAFLVGSVWIYKTKKELFFLNGFNISNNKFNWEREAGHLEKNIGLTLVGSFLMSQLATPILFHFQNAIVAGQMGLSLALVRMINLISSSWMIRQMPNITKAASLSDMKVFNYLFYKSAFQSLIIFILGSSTLCAIVFFMRDFMYSVRIVPFEYFLILIGFELFYFICSILTSYTRSFRRDPFAKVSFIASLLLLALTIFTAKFYSYQGVILGMLSVQMLIVFPIYLYLWQAYKKNMLISG